MECRERARLASERSEAKIAYEEARRALETRIGVTTRDEFLRLSADINEASAALKRARDAFRAHLEEHGCEPATEAAGEE